MKSWSFARVDQKKALTSSTLHCLCGLADSQVGRTFNTSLIMVFSAMACRFRRQMPVFSEQGKGAASGCKTTATTTAARESAPKTMETVASAYRAVSGSSFRL